MAQSVERLKNSKQTPHSVCAHSLDFDSPLSPANAQLSYLRSQQEVARQQSDMNLPTVARPNMTRGETQPVGTHALSTVDPENVKARKKNKFLDSGLTTTFRTLVSKKKRRFVDEKTDLNLDLTYITKQIIAMGFPSSGVEKLYRNKMGDVQKFLNTRHNDKFLVVNLCSERHYDVDKFDGRVFPFPFDDHNCPPFDDMEPFCETLDSWLSMDPENIAAIHCKAGKGRTGLVICIYILHTGTYPDANSALNFYAISRTMNMKGVTIPSQRRWVKYYEIMMRRRREGKYRASKRFRLKSIFTGKDSPSFTSLALFCEKTKDFNTKELKFEPYTHPQYKKGSLLKCPKDWIFHKDVKVQWSKRARKAYQLKSKDKRVFSLWFNTDFIESDNRLVFVKNDIDKVNKVKGAKDFVACFEFEPLDQEEKLDWVGGVLDVEKVLKHPDQLVVLALRMQDEIQIRGRTWKEKTYANVFRGHDALEWLIRVGGARTPDDARKVLDEFRRHGIVNLVTASGQPSGIDGLFRFSQRPSQAQSPSVVPLKPPAQRQGSQKAE